MGKFKYLKKAITTITKGSRKGGKYTRYTYKGGAAAAKTAPRASAKLVKQWVNKLTPTNVFKNIEKIGDPAQLRAISRAAKKNGIPGAEAAMKKAVRIEKAAVKKTREISRLGTTQKKRLTGRLTGEKFR